MLRKGVWLLLLAAVWELYARHLGNPLVFPTFTETLKEFVVEVWGGPLLLRAAKSLQVLLTGYVVGVVIAGLLTSLAIATTPGRDLLELLTALLTPLPAIALLPIALVWFGRGGR